MVFVLSFIILYTEDSSMCHYVKFSQIRSHACHCISDTFLCKFYIGIIGKISIHSDFHTRIILASFCNSLKYKRKLTYAQTNTHTHTCMHTDKQTHTHTHIWYCHRHLMCCHKLLQQLYCKHIKFCGQNFCGLTKRHTLGY